MGPTFIRCLYEEVLNDPSGIALVCRQGPKVRGFAAGTTEPRGFYGRLMARRWVRFALASIVPVIKHPQIVPRLLGAFRKTKEQPDYKGLGLLMSVAVDPELQQGGVGTALVQAFLKECRSRGLVSVHLTTDRSGNARVNRFYSKMGFTISHAITTRQGRVMNDYRIELN
jgi:GNAT superfamily N-acetyltransferase